MRAGKRFQGVLPRRELEAPEAALVAAVHGPHVFHGQARDADGAGHLVVRRNDDLLTQHLVEGRHHSPVRRDAALKEDPLPHPSLTHDAVQVVADDGIGEAAHQLVEACAHLLVVDDVGLHEDGAPLPKPDRKAAFQRLPAELLLDIDPQLLGLLLEIRARPRRARVVHLEVDDHAVRQADVLGVLPPDLEDRVNAGVYVDRRTGLGRYLVPHHVGPDEVPYEVPPGAGAPDAPDIHLHTQLPAHLRQPALDRLERTAGRHEVALRQNPSSVVHGHDVRTDRADVYAEVNGRPGGDFRG